MNKREIILQDGVLTVETNANDKQWQIAVKYVNENSNGTIEEAKKLLKDISSIEIKFQ